MRVEPIELSNNQKNILDLIRRNDQITRAELSKKSGLTAGAITQNCKELLYSGLIREGEKKKGQRGQPSLPLMINENGGISIGVSFSMHFIDLTVLNLKGNSIVTTRQAHNESQPFQDTLKQLRLFVEQTLKSNHLSNARLIGMGYSVSGYLIDGVHRHCVEPLKHWRKLDLTAEFSRCFGVSTWVENNVNAAVLGEFYSGRWNNASSMAFIEMGHGFGGGVVIDSQLVPGHTSNVGEIGSFVTIGPRPSFTDLDRKLKEHGLDIETISADHPLIKEWLKDIKTTVAIATSSCINWVDPEVIVFGGRMPKHILQQVIENFQQDPICVFGGRPLPQIQVSEYGETISAIGAGMLPIYHMLWMN